MLWRGRNLGLENGSSALGISRLYLHRDWAMASLDKRKIETYTYTPRIVLIFRE